jgi:hypothetical protein
MAVGRDVVSTAVKRPLKSGTQFVSLRFPFNGQRF